MTKTGGPVGCGGNAFGTRPADRRNGTRIGHCAVISTRYTRANRTFGGWWRNMGRRRFVLGRLGRIGRFRLLSGRQTGRSTRSGRAPLVLVLVENLPLPGDRRVWL